MDSYPLTGPDGQRSALTRCRSCVFFAEQVPDPATPSRPLSGRCHASPPLRDNSREPVARLLQRTVQVALPWLLLTGILNEAVGWKHTSMGLVGFFATFPFFAMLFVWLRDHDRKQVQPAGLFPIVSADQWCGRWTMRPATPDVAEADSAAARIVRAG